MPSTFLLYVIDLCEAKLYHFAYTNLNQTPILTIPIVHIELECVFRPWEIEILDVLIAVFSPYLQGQGKTTV